MLCLGFLALYIMPRDCTQYLISYFANKTHTFTCLLSLTCMLCHTLSHFHTIKNATSNHCLPYSPSLKFSCTLSISFLILVQTLFLSHSLHDTLVHVSMYWLLHIFSLIPMLSLMCNLTHIHKHTVINTHSHTHTLILLHGHYYFLSCTHSHYSLTLILTLPVLSLSHTFYLGISQFSSLALILSPYKNLSLSVCHTFTHLL